MLYLASAISPDYQPRPWDGCGVLTVTAVPIEASSDEEAVEKSRKWHSLCRLYWVLRKKGREKEAAKVKEAFGKLEG